MAIGADTSYNSLAKKPTNYKTRVTILQEELVMLKSNHILVFLLLIFMSAFAFAGGSGEAATEGGAAAEEEDVYEIIWYHFSGQPNPSEYEQLFGELNEYLAEEIGVTVTFTALDQFDDRMNLIANSGEPWDLAFTAGWAGFNYWENARNGVFFPLNDLLEEYGRGITAALSPRFLEGVKVNGEVYGVPTNKEIGSWPVNVMSKKIIDEYGIDPETMGSLTYETFRPFLERFKQDYPNDYPLWPEPIDGATRERRVISWIDYGLPFVLYNDQRTLQIQNLFEVPEQIAVYKEFKKLIEEGYIHPDLPTLTSIGGRVTDELSSGNFLVKHDLAFPGAGPALEVRYRVPIYFTHTADPVVETGSVSGSMLAISANSERPDKVMQFLNLLNTDVYVRNALNWGIEGVHYDKISENRISRNPDANWPIGQWTLQNFFILWLVEGQPDSLWSDFADFNDSAVASPILGFLPDFDPIRGEIDSLANTVEQFNGFLFDSNSVDEALVEINAQLKRDGYDKAVAELQRQFDEWRASQ